LAGGAGALALVPPQPIVAPSKMLTSSRPSSDSLFRRRTGKPTHSRDARATAELPIATSRDGNWLRIAGSLLAAVDAAVVLTVSVAVTAVVPVIAGGVVTEHVGTSAPPMGTPVTAQLRATVPLKPADGVMVIVDVALGPEVAMVTAVPLRAKLGEATGTTKVKLVVALRLVVEAPVTATV